MEAPRAHQKIKKENINDMKSRGIGDTIEKITKATGIKSVVSKVKKGGCGCKSAGIC